MGLKLTGALFYAAVYAVKPPAAALSEFAFETAKLAAALVFALGGRVTLREAMLAVLAGYATQLASLARESIGKR